MYQFPYKNLLEDAPIAAREQEREAVERSIELMTLAEASGLRSREATDAIYYLQRLWSILIEDLSQPDNRLPKELKAQIISVSIWMLGEAERIRQGQVKSFAGLIEVSRAISKGLK